MDLTMSVMIHMNEETRVEGVRNGTTKWLRIGDSVTIFIKDENQLAELLGGIDQLAKLLVEN